MGLCRGIEVLTKLQSYSRWIYHQSHHFSNTCGDIWRSAILPPYPYSVLYGIWMLQIWKFITLKHCCTSSSSDEAHLHKCGSDLSKKYGTRTKVLVLPHHIVTLTSCIGVDETFIGISSFQYAQFLMCNAFQVRGFRRASWRTSWEF